MSETTSAAMDHPCPYCNRRHPGMRCPDVKSFEYNPDGTIRRVEFFSPWDDLQGTKISIGPILGRTSPLKKRMDRV